MCDSVKRREKVGSVWPVSNRAVRSSKISRDYAEIHSSQEKSPRVKSPGRLLIRGTCRWVSRSEREARGFQRGDRLFGDGCRRLLPRFTLFSRVQALNATVDGSEAVKLLRPRVRPMIIYSAVETRRLSGSIEDNSWSYWSSGHHFSIGRSATTLYCELLAAIVNQIRCSRREFTSNYRSGALAVSLHL